MNVWFVSSLVSSTHFSLSLLHMKYYDDKWVHFKVFLCDVKCVLSRPQNIFFPTKIEVYLWQWEKRKIFISKGNLLPFILISTTISKTGQRRWKFHFTSLLSSCVLINIFSHSQTLSNDLFFITFADLFLCSVFFSLWWYSLDR